MEHILAEAIKKHQEGRLKEALEIYKQILRSNPNHLQCLILTGKIYLKAKKPEAAIPFFEQAYKLQPENLEGLNNLGKAFLQLEKFDEAKSIFSQILETHSDYIPAMLNMAKLYKLEGHLEKSIDLYKRIIALKPEFVIALNNLGNIYQEKGRVSEAVDLYTDAIKISPKNAQLRMNYANVLQIEQDFTDALEQYKIALSLDPKLSSVYKNLANLYTKLYSYEKALIEIESLYKASPSIPDILLTASILAINNGDFKLAIKLLSKNHQNFPEHFDSLYQLGISLHQTGFFNKALKVYEKAYALKKDSELLLYAMAKVYSDLKQDNISYEFLIKASVIDSDNFTIQHELIRHRLNTCDWSNRLKDQENLRDISLKQIDIETQAPIPFLNLNYFKQDNFFLLKCSEHAANNSLRKVEKLRSELNFSHSADAKNKLKIGYISPDFRDHPTGRVTIDFISMHNKDEFEIFCFSLIADLPEDIIQNKFKQNCDHFISLYNVPIATAAKKIFEQKIDILVDLAGYTTYSRTEILALQPAPIQCQMIGFPGSMGAPFIQYIIADRFLVPKEHESFYSEKIIRLPYGFPGSVLEANQKKLIRRDFGLPEDVFIYCCFNSQYKYSPELFDIWMDVLKNVPDSILLLKGGNEKYKNNILKETHTRQMDQSRIYFAENLSFPDYMARNKVCDLFLDTFFYNAGSTAVNALQMGLPILTFAGETNASRMGASIINATDLKDFICKSVDEYKEKAIFYGKNKTVLDQIKTKFSTTVLESDLFDSKKFVSNLEIAFNQIWESFIVGKQAESFDVE